MYTVMIQFCMISLWITNSSGKWNVLEFYALRNKYMILTLYMGMRMGWLATLTQEYTWL